MKKIDIKQVCEAYNTARVQNQGKKFSPEKAKQVLINFGISGNLAKKMISNSTLFQRSQRENQGKGNFKCLIFPYSSIHITWFENWIYPVKKEEKKQFSSFEEECAEYLKNQGYELKKCLGFDEERFAKENPEMYKSYLIYEKI